MKHTPCARDWENGVEAREGLDEGLILLKEGKKEGGLGRKSLRLQCCYKEALVSPRGSL